MTSSLCFMNKLIKQIVVNKVPTASMESPFDYVVVTMKTIPEIMNIAEIIAPSVTPNHTTIVLLQNGIYIEPPIIDAFPTNAVLSGPSYIGAHEKNGHVIHDDPDRYHLGVFHNERLDKRYERAKLEDFASAYNGSHIEHAMIVDDIIHYRWRKALWNGIFNTMCAITQLDRDTSIFVPSGHRLYLTATIGLFVVPPSSVKLAMQDGQKIDL